MERNAARDPDGKLVFKYADGRVVYADGTAVEPEIAEGIIWPDDAPRAEDYFAKRDHHTAVDAKLHEWSNYRNDVLGGIRDRYDDRKNPFEDHDGVKDALEQIDASRAKLASLEIEHEAVVETPNTIPSTFPQILPGT